jgi:DNA modification methylase
VKRTARERLRIRHVHPGELKPWERNPRKLKYAVGPVAKSIKQFGFNVPILCNADLRVIAGHARLEAAKRLGMEKVPVAVLPLEGNDCELFAIAENKTGELADWDTPKLKQVLDELRSEECDLRSLGFSPRELRRLLREEQDRENAIPELSAKPRTKHGTLWRLGRHRLLCGDSRHKKTFTRLLGKAKVDHVFAGPPYFNQRGYSHWDDYARYLEDMNAVIQRCHAVLRDGAIVVWNVGNGSATKHAHVVHHAGLLEESGFRFVDMIVWKKNVPNFAIPRHANIKGNRHYYPAHQWEALHVYRKPGSMPTMNSEGARYMWEHATDVWEISSVTHQQRDMGHNAVCPVEIPFRSLQAYTGEGGSVLDPFGGSGTTLIAAERAGRKAFIVEKCPEYCDRIVNRWEEFTGKRARRGAPKATTKSCR